MSAKQSNDIHRPPEASQPQTIWMVRNEQTCFFVSVDVTSWRLGTRSQGSSCIETTTHPLRVGFGQNFWMAFHLICLPCRQHIAHEVCTLATALGFGFFCKRPAKPFRPNKPPSSTPATPSDHLTHSHCVLWNNGASPPRAGAGTASAVAALLDALASPVTRQCITRIGPTRRDSEVASLLREDSPASEVVTLEVARGHFFREKKHTWKIGGKRRFRDAASPPAR